MQNTMNSQYAYHKLPRVALLVVFAMLLTAGPGLAADPVVHAIIFYSPTCGHCHQVLTVDLPPLLEKYGDQLQIVGINVTIEAGQQLYQAAIERFQIPDDRLGVPCLIVGDTVLVGSGEIPAVFPGIIEAGLAGAGIAWPDIPGLSETLDLPEEPVEAPASEAGEAELPAGENSAANPAIEAEELSAMEKFALDPVGNSVSVVVLVGMIASLGVFSTRFLGNAKATRRGPYNLVPVLVLAGLVVAGYLSFVEMTNTEAVCGPVGDCNSVQTSPYATLFGFLPVGVLGLVGYVLLGAFWVLDRFGPAQYRDSAALALWAMAAVGVLFSIYLTFLEPFVIGATCAWCITSALVITLILWASTGRAAQARRS